MEWVKNDWYGFDGGWYAIEKTGRNLRICPEGLSMCIRSFRKTQDTHCMWEYKQSAGEAWNVQDMEWEGGGREE